MKKLFRFLGLIAIGIVIGFAGCGDDDSDGGESSGGTGGGGGGGGGSSYSYLFTNGTPCIVNVSCADLNPSDFQIPSGGSKRATSNLPSVQIGYNAPCYYTISADYDSNSRSFTFYY